jgi:hypothetical protein
MELCKSHRPCVTGTSQNRADIIPRLPSGGLIETPEDAKFYDWHLLDPKDRPFATFNFHYRSWDSLISLQLVPEDHPRALLFPSPSILSLNGHSLRLKPEEEETALRAEHERMNRDAQIRKGAPDSLGADDKIDTQSPLSEARDSTSSDNSTTPWMTDVFDDGPEDTLDSDRRAAFKVPRAPSPYCRAVSPTPTGIPTSKFSGSGVPGYSSRIQRELDDLLDRPLPALRCLPHPFSGLLRLCPLEDKYWGLNVTKRSQASTTNTIPASLQRFQISHDPWPFPQRDKL